MSQNLFTTRNNNYNDGTKYYENSYLYRYINLEIIILSYTNCFYFISISLCINKVRLL